MKGLFMSTVVSLLLLLAPRDSSGQQTLSGLAGVVGDSAGRPVAPATVEASHSGSDRASPLDPRPLRRPLSHCRPAARDRAVPFPVDGFMSIRAVDAEWPAGFAVVRRCG
jgi:hypothetical protein